MGRLLASTVWVARYPIQAGNLPLDVDAVGLGVVTRSPLSSASFHRFRKRSSFQRNGSQLIVDLAQPLLVIGRMAAHPRPDRRNGLHVDLRCSRAWEIISSMSR